VANAPGQHLLDIVELLDLLSAEALPVDDGAELGRDEALAEDMVRHMRETVKLDWDLASASNKLDALNDGRGMRVVLVHVGEPQRGLHVLCLQQTAAVRNISFMTR